MLVGLVASAPQVLAAEPLPSAVTFAIYRDGQDIGRHSLTFENKGGTRVVTVNVDISVQKFGVVAYRYKHHGSEVWKDDRLESLKTNTDDNGRLYTVEGHRTAQGFEVERSAPAATAAVQAADSGLLMPSVSHETLPGDVLPTTLWNVETVRRSSLLNTQYGTLSKIKVESLGREDVPLKSGNRKATHYHFTGDLQMDLWFDGEGHWIKATFRTPDGSTVDYVLAE